MTRFLQPVAGLSAVGLPAESLLYPSALARGYDLRAAGAVRRSETRQPAVRQVRPGAGGASAFAAALVLGLGRFGKQADVLEGTGQREDE